MTFQHIITHLEKPRKWYIVATPPRAELNTLTRLQKEGYITYLPLTPVRRQWAGRIKEIHIPVVTRCVFIYATAEEIREIGKRYPTLPSDSIQI